MNEIKLSGVLEDIKEQNSAAGTFLVARLRFDSKNDVLLVVAGDRMIDAFGPFDAQDSIGVVGRVGVLNGSVVVLVDEVVPWKRASPARDEHKVWNDRRDRRQGKILHRIAGGGTT